MTNCHVSACIRNIVRKETDVKIDEGYLGYIYPDGLDTVCNKCFRVMSKKGVSEMKRKV